MKKLVLSLSIALSTLASYAQDLIVQSVSIPSTFRQYEEIDIQVTTKNKGIVPTTSFFSSNVYLSIDDQLDTSSDYWIGFLETDPLTAGEAVTEEVRLIQGLYTKVPQGVYYLIIEIDHNLQIAETDETNNVFFTPNIVISLPDVNFVLSSFALDKLIYSPSESIKPTFSAENLGSSNVLGLLGVGFYLSEDTNLDEEDILINAARKFLTGLDLLSTSDLTNGLFMPNVPLGNYYLIAKADFLPLFDETNELDNILIQAITVQASDIDLEITSVRIDGAGFGIVSAFVSIMNNGTTGAGGFELVAAITPLGETFNNFLPPVNFDATTSYLLGGESKQIFITFPYVVPSGIYNLVLKVNPLESIIETNYTNNTSSITPLFIPPPLIQSVDATSLSVSGSYDNTDQEIKLNLGLTNTGTTTSFYQYYVIEIKDDNNQLVYSRQIQLAVDSQPSESKIFPLTFALSGSLNEGQYQVTLSCGNSCNTTRLPLLTNLTISPTQYTLTGNVQGTDGANLNKGKLFLYQQDDEGKIKFVQKIVPITTSSFSFSVDDHPHTLYFEPDPADFADYLPTILGKSLVLNSGSFFTLSENTQLVFEIIKIQPPLAGPAILNGTISQSTSNPSGRGSGIPLAGVPIILMSGSGVAVSFSHTNESGFYEFKQLPRAKYSLIIPGELDSKNTSGPIAVDLTQQNQIVDFEMSPEGVAHSIEPLLFEQKIDLDNFGIAAFGQSPVDLPMTSDSGLPISYITSDSEFAEINDTKLVIKNAGSVTLTAKQSGNEFFLPLEKSRLLTINKGIQSISFAALPEKDVADGKFKIAASSTSLLEVMFISDNEALATIVGDVVSIHAPGIANITASQSGNRNYLAAPSITRQLVINKILGTEGPSGLITLYPNPTSDFVYINNSDDIKKVQVFDLLGRETNEVSQISNRLDFRNVASGMYIVCLICKQGTIVVRIQKN